MNDYNNGKIWGWNGGDRPVHPKSKVNVWFRGGSKILNGSAGQLGWGHGDTDGDIVRFQVTKVHVEPKVIYVNEYKEIGLNRAAGVAWPTEKAAKNDAQPYHTRIAVKYTEEQK